MSEKKDLIALEKKNKERHIPGYHFCGPGTKVVTRLTSGDYSGEPINRLDAACMRHDIEYFKYAGNDAKLREADARLRNAAAEIGGVSGILIDKIFFFKKLAEKIGFFTPSGFAAKLSKNLTIPEQRKLGDILFKKYIEGIPTTELEEQFFLNKKIPDGKSRQEDNGLHSAPEKARREFLRRKLKRHINGNENGAKDVHDEMHGEQHS